MLRVISGSRQNISSFFKGDGIRACDILRKRFKSFKGLQLHKLIAQLTILRKTSSVSIVDYLNSGDDTQYKLTLVNEGISEKVFDSLNLKGLPKNMKISQHS